MMQQRTYIRKAGAIIIQDKKLLIVKPRGKPFWITPGGKYEGEEDAEACLRRELDEELCVDLDSFSHYKTYVFDKAAHSNDQLRLELYLVTLGGEWGPSSEIERAKWYTHDELLNMKDVLAPSFQRVISDLVRDGLL